MQDSKKKNIPCSPGVSGTFTTLAPLQSTASDLPEFDVADATCEAKAESLMSLSDGGG